MTFADGPLAGVSTNERDVVDGGDDDPCRAKAGVIIEPHSRLGRTLIRLVVGSYMPQMIPEEAGANAP